MIDKKRILEKYKKLVKINTYTKNERMLADILTGELLNLGCKVKEDNTATKIKGNTGNIIAEYPGMEGTSPVLLLSAHMDRIKRSNNIKIRVEEDIIQGYNGNVGGDDLAGIVTILEILYQLKYNISEHIGLKIIFTVAEESGLLGSQNLSIQDLKPVKYGLVYDGEGKAGTIINCSPAFKSINIIIKGENIKNVYKASTAVISGVKTGKIDNETKLNISTDKNVDSKNSINSLGMNLGILTFNTDKLNEYIESIKKNIEGIALDYGCKVEYYLSNFYEGFCFKIEDELLQFLKESAKNIDLDIKLKRCFGGSDANIFNQMNISTVNLGTGLQKAHSLNATVNLEDIAKLVEYTLEIMRVIEVNYYV